MVRLEGEMDMSTDCKIDNRKVACSNASLIAGGTYFLKAGMLFTYETGAGIAVARSLGRVSASASQAGGLAVDGWILAMVLSDDCSFVFERWVNPADVRRIIASPSKMAAFFFAPELAYDAQMIRRLMAYGTLSEAYVEKAAERVEMWERESA